MRKVGKQEQKELTVKGFTLAERTGYIKNLEKEATEAEAEKQMVITQLYKFKDKVESVFDESGKLVDEIDQLITDLREA